MIISAIQYKAESGNINANITSHTKFIELAAGYNANLVFFPELSLTGYGPRLGKSLAITASDPVLNIFQEQSDRWGIIVGIGLPLKAGENTEIGMVWFVPNKSPSTYSKQQLHADELPFFVSGEKQFILESGDYRFAPAICFESLQQSHADHAVYMGANVYLASVAKSEKGLAKVRKHYPEIARKHNLFVIMANCLGPNDDFVSIGQSAIWARSGELLAQMDSDSEGILILDLESEKTTIYTVK